MALKSIHLSEGDDHDRIECRISALSLRPSSNSAVFTGSWSGTDVPDSPSRQWASVAKAAKDIATSEEPEATVTKVTGALRAFKLFPGLPVELRLSIWRHAASQPRIIEMHAESHPVRSTNSFGRIANTCLPSHRAPAILHANRESRQEALKQYTLRTFSTSSRPNPLYFNNRVDVLLFGKGCGANGLMEKVFRASTTYDLPLARVAIAIEEFPGWVRLLHTLEQLHGFPGETGCIGLRDVTFVLPTNLWGLKSGKVDSKWELTATNNYGLTASQIFDMEVLEEKLDILDRNDDGAFARDHGLSNWITGSAAKPSFAFASLRPIGLDGMVRDGLNLSNNDLQELSGHNWHILKTFQKSLGIEIEIAPSSFNPAFAESKLRYGPDDQCREVGVTGEDQILVAKGIKTIKDFLEYITTLDPDQLE